MIMKHTLLIAITLNIILASCHQQPRDDDQPEQFSLTDTMMQSTRFGPATTQVVKNELRLYGKVAADNSKLSQVFPIVGGSVQKVNVELGDYVKQGSILASIRSGEVAGYERERLDAVSDVANAEKNLQVANDLFAGKLNSEKDVLAAKTDLAKSKADLQRINELYGIYNMKPGAMYNVTAPISGFVIEKNITQNVLLNSNNVNNLFTIAQIDDVWILANVNESDIGLIRQGMDAEVRTMSYPDRVFHGKVDRIFNILDPETKSMKVRIKIANKDLALKPEMSTTVMLDFDENKKLIAIPSDAIVFDKSKNWVMVYHDRKKIETRLVDIYRQIGDTTYVSNGLREGENVITKNQLLIYDQLND
jgi:membrane fusion protein, heavy metal efflux system